MEANPLSPQRSQPAGVLRLGKLTLVLLGMLVAIILSGAVILAIHWYAEQAAPDTKTPALAAQYFVKMKVGPGSIVKFNPLDWTTIETSGENTTVSGWVEVVDKEGRGSGVYDYRAVLSSVEGNWQLVKLDMMLR